MDHLANGYIVPGMTYLPDTPNGPVRPTVAYSYVTPAVMAGSGKPAILANGELMFRCYVPVTGPRRCTAFVVGFKTLM